MPSAHATPSPGTPSIDGQIKYSDISRSAPKTISIADELYARAAFRVGSRDAEAVFSSQGRDAFRAPS